MVIWAIIHVFNEEAAVAGDTFLCIGTKYCEKSVVVYICLCVNQLDSNSRCCALGQLLCADVNVTLWCVYLHVHAFTLKRTQCYR